ncbi:MAG: hypothetical protein ACP5T0_02955 [Verrucomicrobiia bacterium]
MNMQNEHNEFDKLVKLLSIKRYEKPDKAYFDTFSSRVINRIVEEDSQPSQEFWLVNLIRTFIARPVYAASFAAVVIGLAVLAIRPLKESELQLNQSAASHNNPFEIVQPSKQEPAGGEINNYNQLTSSGSSEHSSTNPVAPNSAMPSLFQQIPTLVNPTPANYSPK